MGIVERMAGWLGHTEKRADDPSWDHIHALNVGGSASVDPRAAENLATATACVQVIAGAMASLPALVYRIDGKGRTEDTEHPLARLIRRGPNPHQTWPDFVEWLAASVLLRGNGLAEVVTDSRGDVTTMHPIPWEWVSVKRTGGGRLVYDVSEPLPFAGSTKRRLLDTEVLHLRDRSDDGLVGRSRIQRASETFENALAVQTFSNSMLGNGLYPSGVVQSDSMLSPAARSSIRTALRDGASGPKNAARFLILDGGMTWQSISVSPEDAELLASRRFSTEEIARIFQVPPPLVGIWDHSSFTNSETAGRWFAQHTLGPWIAKIEAAFHRSVFTDAGRATHELEIDVSGFLRGDPEARWQNWKIAVDSGILDKEEVREAEGWNPRQGGAE